MEAKKNDDRQFITTLYKRTGKNGDFFVSATQEDGGRFVLNKTKEETRAKNDGQGPYLVLTYEADYAEKAKQFSKAKGRSFTKAEDDI